ncbi:CHAP domain-containing protein [Lacticaseibacillus zhaodongensis]|uniref:CHAP domain-containing protein n=1 Tax=Lacticaseibacillus zhaodongensis TaxID=2668065 RepID=UPI0012D2DE1E|nr:CHAP domain-containing protein [Lacticaseibacillus zhaodongensis]
MKTAKLMVTAIAALTVASNVAGSLMTVSADSVSDAQSAITANKSKSAKIVASIEKANAKVIDLNRQVSDKDAAISKANKDISAAKAQIAKLDTQITAQKKEITARKDIMAKQLVSLQKETGDSVTGNVYADFILNSKNLSDLVSRGVTVNKLNQANKDALDAVQNAKSKLDSLQSEQEAKAKELEANKQSLVTDKADLVSLKADAQKQESALAKTLKDNKTLLASLQNQFDKATAAKTAAAKAAADKAAAAKAAKADGSATSVTTVAAASSAASGSYSASGNTYPWGQCTWYAKQRSGWAGNGWGNGGQWGASAAAQGFQVDHTPAAGALVSFAPGQNVGGWTADGSYGHVAYVESVSGNTITISQGGMGFSNPAGPNTQTISGASAFTYIHPKN